MKIINSILTAIIFLFCFSYADAQIDNEATLILDLKKAKADFEIARQKLENDTKLYNEKAISANDFSRSKNELLSREVDYQKLILKLISQQSYLTVEKAIKYQDKRGERKVKLTIKSAMEGNEEYLNQFEDHFDIFTPEMRSGKVYNIYVSLKDNETGTIIGAPYEYRIPSISLGGTYIADFDLLKDAENLTVLLNYNNRKDEKNIYLQKDSHAQNVDITSMQFSQEADLSSRASYDITLERFSMSDDIYRLEIRGLPRQISYDFTDGGSKVSQIKFAQGVNMKRLSLQVYLPDRSDDNVIIDKPIDFEVVAISASTAEEAGKEKLEIIPRGRGRIEVRTSSLYHEITNDARVEMEITVKNAGTRVLDNIKLTTEKPLGWDTQLEPSLILILRPEEEKIVTLVITPPSENIVGAQEIKLRTEAMVDNRKVTTEDKTIRIQVKASTSVIGTLFLIILLIVILGGIVWVGMKISKR